MALYAQHGHGKSDKLPEAIKNGSLDGVIFAARNEQPSALQSLLHELRSHKVVLLVDPQFYVSAFIPPRDRYLPEYPHYRAGRVAGDFVGAKRLREYAKTTLDFQLQLGVDRVISPSVYARSFEDRWYQIALNLADASIDYHGSLKKPPPLLLTFLVDEHALATSQMVDDFLDQVTTWDVHGVYLIVARSENTYSQRFDPTALKNLFYACHVLGVINGFEVVSGYTDFLGLSLRAAGVHAFGTGWAQSGRRFHRSSFVQRRRGGRHPRLRYASGPLLNSVLLSELEQIADVDQLDSVLSGVKLDETIRKAASPEASAWNQRTSELHHWQTLAKLDGELQHDEAKNVALVEQHIQTASALYTLLQEQGVMFDRNSEGGHLTEWQDAIQAFKKRAGL
jgi:hypothetical protein